VSPGSHSSNRRGGLACRQGKPLQKRVGAATRQSEAVIQSFPPCVVVVSGPSRQAGPFRVRRSLSGSPNHPAERSSGSGGKKEAEAVSVTVCLEAFSVVHSHPSSFCNTEEEFRTTQQGLQRWCLRVAIDWPWERYSQNTFKRHAIQFDSCRLRDGSRIKVDGCVGNVNGASPASITSVWRNVYQ
jgi:hypothetical protein